MSRFRLIAGTVSVVSIGCVVAALVQAQDATGRWSVAKGAGSAASSAGTQLAEQYKAAGQSVTSAYAAGVSNGPSASNGQPPEALTAHQAPATMLASDEAPASGTLRSVLKRNAAPASPAAPPAPAPASRPESESPPAEQTLPASPPADSRPEPRTPVKSPVTLDQAPASPLIAPSSPAVPSSLLPPASDADDSLSPRVSSRRTQRPLVAATSPANVAAKPIPTQRGEAIPLAGGSTPAATDAPLTLAKSAGPALRVEVVGPPAAQLGEEVAFKIHVLNQGEAEAKGIAVRVAVPDGARVVTAEAAAGDARVQTEGGATQVLWNLEKLQAQAASGLTLKLIPTVNQPIELAIDWSLQPVTATTRIEVKQSLLEVALSGPADMVYGDTKVFSIVLSNPGSGDARDVAVNVALGPNASDTMNVGTIAAGTSKTFDFEVTARQTGTMQIAATASASGNLKQEAVHQVLIQRAELEVEASGPEMEFAGGAGSYGVRVANKGNATARNVQVLVRMPQGARYLQGVGNVRSEGSGLVWQLGDLAPATERMLGFDCELVADGELQFQATVRGDGALEVSDELTTRVEAVADLKLSVNDPKGPIPVGQEVVYEIHVVNRGSKAATQVNVIAQFSEGIEPVATDGMPGEVQAGQVIFQPIAQINPKETVKLTVKAKAQSDGNHVFRAAVQCSDPDTRLVAEDNTRFYGSGTLRKADSSAVASPSDQKPDAARVGEVPAASDSVYKR
jgi:hypothetical protein